jgi:hypothetical protein
LNDARRWAIERAWEKRRSQSERFCESPICTRLMLSTPPTRASSLPPCSSIEAASSAATMLVEQASTVENAGTVRSRPASI